MAKKNSEVKIQSSLFDALKKLDSDIETPENAHRGVSILGRNCECGNRAGAGSNKKAEAVIWRLLQCWDITALACRIVFHVFVLLKAEACVR